MRKSHIDKLTTIEEGSIKINTLIICKGSDARAYESLRLCQLHNIKIERVVLISFDQREKALSKELDENYNKYKDYNFEYVEIKISLYSEFMNLLSSLESEIDIKTIEAPYLDITCFLKPHFFFVTKWLYESGIRQINYFYTEPESYSFVNNLYDKYEYSEGPLEISSIIGFNGVDTGLDESILIMQLGFEGNLSSEIYEDCLPNKLYIQNGFPSYIQKFKDISLINNISLIEQCDEKIKYGNSYDPFKCYNSLSRIISENQSKKVTLACLGTKPMALAVCLLALENPEFRVVYPFPQNFINKNNNKFSTCWHYQVNFR